MDDLWAELLEYAGEGALDAVVLIAVYEALLRVPAVHELEEVEAMT